MMKRFLVIIGMVVGMSGSFAQATNQVDPVTHQTADNTRPANPKNQAATAKEKIDQQVIQLIQLQIQKDPGHPPSADQVILWKKQLSEGADFRTLQREINQSTPVASAPVEDADAPKMVFPTGTTYDYGEVLESNEPVPHDFEFVNAGKKPLIIQEAHGSCGCTVPTYSKEPVLPGQKGVITVKYSTHGRVGPINKDVTITSNANPTSAHLHITGNVRANPDLDKAVLVPVSPTPATGTGNK